MVHELLDYNFDNRVPVCEFLLDINNQKINVSEHTFTLNGHINRQNCRYSATENPPWIQECHIKRPPKNNVLAGIVEDHILELFMKKY